jgi:hypothetical protein
MPAGIHASLRKTCLEIKEIANALEGVRYSDEEILDHNDRIGSDREAMQLLVVNDQMGGLIEKMEYKLGELKEWFGDVNR